MDHDDDVFQFTLSKSSVRVTFLISKTHQSFPHTRRWAKTLSRVKGGGYKKGRSAQKELIVVGNK